MLLTRQSPLDSLAADAATLGVTLDAEQIELLRRYGLLIRKWNERINLVSRKDIDRLENRHFVDSLAAVPLIAESGAERREERSAATPGAGRRVLDIGSGAGLPGIPMAIALPDVEFVLCDRMARRCRFLTQAKQHLELENVAIVAGDAVDLENGPFNTVTARAVAPADTIWGWVENLLTVTGQLLVFSSTSDEVSGSSAGEIGYDIPYRVTYHRYLIPGLDQVHTLMQMERPAQ